MSFFGSWYTQWASYPVIPCDIPAIPLGKHERFTISSYYTEVYAFSGSGTCSTTDDEGVFDVTFSLQWTAPSLQTLYYVGQLDVLAGSISGSHGTCEDKEGHYSEFLMRRTPAQLLRFRPSPTAFIRNKASALWEFAASAVMYQVRKRLWSHTFFRDRWQHRKDYLYHTVQIAFGLPSANWRTYWQLRQYLSPYDTSLYDYIKRRQQKKLTER